MTNNEMYKNDFWVVIKNGRPYFKICEGCISYKLIGEHKRCMCNLLPAYNKKQCPCSSCLVKTMCEAVCKKFEIYVSKYPLLPLVYNKGDI